MLDPDMTAFVRETERFYPADATGRPIAAQRTLYDAYCRAFAPPRPAGVTSSDAVLGAAPGVALRCYHGPAGGQRGTLIYLHGGGFVLGGLDSHDAITARLAVELDAVVVAVDYRLAPEHPFPAACDDADAVVTAALERTLPFDLPPGPVLLAGDSAGGTLAASAALTRRDRGGRQPAGMVLIYPMLGPEAGDNSSMWNEAERPHSDSPSPLAGERRAAAQMRGAAGTELAAPPHPALPGAPSPARGEGAEAAAGTPDQTEAVNESDSPLLSSADVIWYRDTWLAGAAPAARAFPLLAPDLGGLPPMLLLAAEHDVLRDHAVAFAARVAADRGDATAVVCEGLVHGSLRALGRSPAADRMMGRTVDFLRQRLADTN
jgi:acetyl esterase